MLYVVLWWCGDVAVCAGAKDRVGFSKKVSRRVEGLFMGLKGIVQKSKNNGYCVAPLNL